MKARFKSLLDHQLIFLAEQWPGARRLLRPLGLRTAPEGFRNRVASVNGSQRFRLTHADECYLAFQLFWRGVDYYEPITRQLLLALLKPGHTFIDMGAHLGFFSIVAGLYAHEVNVIAFEPNPKNFRILQANRAANGLANMVCEPMAISDRDGIASLYLTKSDMSASLMKDFQAEDTEQIGSIEVHTTSLDSYLTRHRVPAPLLIKVDVEGHEPAFLSGARETLLSLRPDIILEVLYDLDPEIVSQLKLLGYRFYPITDMGFFETEAPTLVKRFPFLFLNHLLSVRPKEEIASAFKRIASAIAKLDLRETSKHFPIEEWPLLWQSEPAPAGAKTCPISANPTS